MNIDRLKSRIPWLCWGKFNQTQSLAGKCALEEDYWVRARSLSYAVRRQSSRHILQVVQKIYGSGKATSARRYLAGGKQPGSAVNKRRTRTAQVIGGCSILEESRVEKEFAGQGGRMIRRSPESRLKRRDCSWNQAESVGKPTPYRSQCGSVQTDDRRFQSTGKIDNKLLTDLIFSDF